MEEPAKEPFWKLGLVVWFTTGAWVGFFPIMPGTVGSLWGIPLAWWLSRFPIAAQLGFIAAAILIGIPLCTIAAKRIGRKDPGCIVWDEIATVPVTFLFVPAAQMSNGWVLLAGFVLHRVFDISKPPPARQLERLPDGLGIMIDDCVAGVYSCAVLHAALHFGIV
ncbi:MAG: phosphatidylglycerophosphatase A [Planctomycetales bacterium]|nr:phosphatidylglycerophosphatase A [Planctomycetales bacterium]